jgi:hypothetical protein
MSPQYLVAKQCLQLLKEINLSCTKKLRLEIQLIQLLRLLLQEDVTATEAGPCSKEAFDELYQSVCAMHRHHHASHDAITAITERLGGILAILSSRPMGTTNDTACAPL